VSLVQSWEIIDLDLLGGKSVQAESSRARTPIRRHSEIMRSGSETLAEGFGQGGEYTLISTVLKGKSLIKERPGRR
jgi:hypothetical protein